jgi:hypothetical protein
VANAEGESPAIAPNTWVEIKDKVSVGREVKMEIPDEMCIRRLSPRLGPVAAVRNAIIGHLIDPQFARRGHRGPVKPGIVPCAT